MSATLRITCAHNAPGALDWANQINTRFRHPVAVIDGEEHQLRWDSPVSIPVGSGQPHQFHVFFEVLGILRWGGADLEMPPQRDGEMSDVEYRVSLNDRYLNTAHLRLVRQQQ